jgi:hypothetical protein
MELGDHHDLANRLLERRLRLLERRLRKKAASNSVPECNKVELPISAEFTVDGGEPQTAPIIRAEAK